jgi:SAM-dependent methyltransferase
MNTTEVDKKLDFTGIDWSPHSFEDPGGRIFWSRGRLFRALRGRSAQAFQILEKKGLIEKFEEWGLVKTWRADLRIPGYDVVVEHEVLPMGPVVSEWSPSMLFDASSLYCDLSAVLAEHQLQLQDSHGWNIMFRHARPVYVDFASLVPLGANEPWKPLEEWINCFLHPLHMIARRQADYAFYLLGTQNWVSEEAATPYLFRYQHRIMRKLRKLKYRRWEKIRHEGGSASVLKLLEIMKREVSKYQVRNLPTRWSDYSSGFPNPSQTSIDQWNDKQRSVHKILLTLEKGRILDLGCNTGWYSLLAEGMGFDVVAMDMDRHCIDKLYRRAKEQNLRIAAVVASPFWPIIPHGPRFYESLEKRFQADHVLMLALAHHLYFKQGYNVKSIVAIAASLTRKTLILEYVPPADYWIQQWKVPHGIDEYELDVWLAELGKIFRRVEVLPSECSHPSSPVRRSLIVAEH